MVRTKDRIWPCGPIWRFRPRFSIGSECCPEAKEKKYGSIGHKRDNMANWPWNGYVRNFCKPPIGGNSHGCDTVIKHLNTNLAKNWAEFQKPIRQLSLILEEKQTVRRELRNVQQKQENLGKEIYYLYEKEVQEENFFPHTNQGDEPILHTSQKVKNKGKSENQVPAHLNPRLRPEFIFQDGKNLSCSQKKALNQFT
ncbi:hypothetical protein O181_122874 [Austropuccinia psidii MF-1]|uniref:Uncharacterized protein n=1 Tax=Austropuccinia psidii MF-1 TaxID=1389203 RepID=A0A9Q3Q2R2_9BASI|nr:hypothetical protein [Austropuccinia psidii MF-1]